jgi:hypothetical protein
MSYSLGFTDYINESGWCKVLQLARIHGWEPGGTRMIVAYHREAGADAPVEVDMDTCKRDEEYVNWLFPGRNYRDHYGPVTLHEDTAEELMASTYETVDAQDAGNMGVALSRALEAIERGSFAPGSLTESFNSPAGIEIIDDVIRVCGDGEFSIL